jgi:hypothetical protein
METTAQTLKTMEKAMSSKTVLLQNHPNIRLAIR